MDLGYPFDTVVHYLLIRGVTCFICQNGFPMVSVACDAHWTRPTVNHNTRLSIVMILQATILHGLSTLKGY